MAGQGYGPRGCAAEGCGAVLAYPDEGAACADHTCTLCGATIHPLEVFPLPFMDREYGGVAIDYGAAACLACYGAFMNRLPISAILTAPARSRA